ncbi:hypothetical protein EVAR_54760_1 [Eumeta japonica]|uniref:Uncharacterized protein n=1 Tax=Eumeta variegata TaxID=151549 RepID=A0A4C1YB16_EUMVA|nr:hypothetical protein EVAR_54760_1 [Eumeta japonica]
MVFIFQALIGAVQFRKKSDIPKENEIIRDEIEIRETLNRRNVFRSIRNETDHYHIVHQLQELKRTFRNTCMVYELIDLRSVNLKHVAYLIWQRENPEDDEAKPMHLRSNGPVKESN